MVPPGGRVGVQRSPDEMSSTSSSAIHPRRQENPQQQQQRDQRQRNHDTNVTVLDGGFASQLSCHVQQPVDGDPLWSARFLATDPEAVIDTHLDFLRAGADVILTNSYQASIEGFKTYLQLEEKECIELIGNSVRLARTAIERFLNELPDDSDRPKPRIVGSIGPYGASLHDGSEYTGSYAKHVTPETMRNWHRPRIAALVESGIDILALETIPAKSEAEMLVELIKEFPKVKAWLAFSCSQDGKSIAEGEDFQKVAKHCYSMNPDQIIAVGVNCLAPKLVESLIKNFNKDRTSNPIPLVVYPNSGENYNVNLGWIDRDKCEPVEVYVRSWLDLGVKYVGGCCRTYAADISRIKSEVSKWKHERFSNGCKK